MAMLEENGKAAGFTSMGRGLFGTDVFLAAVYAIYMYTDAADAHESRVHQSDASASRSGPEAARRPHHPCQEVLMPIGGRKVPPHAVEHEEAIVASTISGREVELNGMWNRMFEPRVITAHDA